MAEVGGTSNSPIWHRLAREMRADGASIARIADEFGAPLDLIEDIVIDIDVPSNRGRMKKLHADPEFAARNRERMKKLHADPEFAARHRERMKKLHADPEFATRRRERMKKLHADPEFAARVGRRPKWCPLDRMDEYRRLSASLGRTWARAIILAGGATR